MNHLPIDDTASDERWMVLFQSGSDEAFRVLFDRYAVRLYNFCLRYFDSSSEAEDLSQEALIRVFLKKDRYDPRRPFRPWLFSIAAHLVSNRLRTARRHPHVPLEPGSDDGESDSFIVERPDPRQSAPDATAEQGEVVRAVRRALASLPENQRTAVILARYEEMSYEEIAAAMNLSVSAVTALLFRARKALQEALGAVASRETPQ